MRLVLTPLDLAADWRGDIGVDIRVDLEALRRYAHGLLTTRSTADRATPAPIVVGLAAHDRCGTLLQTARAAVRPVLAEVAALEE